MINLDIDWLRKNCSSIAYFGIIGIQLKLDFFHRLHFYTSELSPIISEEEIHSHRYDFTSFVLKGSLNQYIYNIVPGNNYIREEESCREGVCISKDPTFCNIELQSEHLYSVGSKYFISHTVFHKVKTESCITYLERSNYKKENAEVIRLASKEKVCPFSKKVNEEELWEIVNKMIKG